MRSFLPSRTNVLNSIAAGGRVLSTRPSVRRAQPPQALPAPDPVIVNPVAAPAPVEAPPARPFATLHGYFHLAPNIPLASQKSSKKQKRAPDEMVPHGERAGRAAPAPAPAPAAPEPVNDAMDVENEESSNSESDEANDGGEIEAAAPGALPVLLRRRRGETLAFLFLSASCNSRAKVCVFRRGFVLPRMQNASGQ